MRALQGIVGAEVLAVIVLLVMVLAPGDVVPPRLATAGDASAVGVAAAASGNLGERGDATQTVEANRDRVEVRAGAGEIVLQGRLLGIENLPGAKVRLSCRRDGSWRYATVHDGHYAIAGLAPGTWRVRCHGEGLVKLEFDHTITEAPVQHLDLELERALALPVFLRTTDGARLSTELTRLHIRGGLHVIAVDEPLAGDLDPLWSINVGDVGAGRFLDPLRGANVEADGSDGRLELDRPPPLHAVLLLRHLVLAQQPLVPGQRELTFAIDLATVKARLATVQVRVVAADGRQIKGNVLLISSGVLGALGQPSDGPKRIEGVLPGLVRLLVAAEGLEPYSNYATLEPGMTTDLGEIVLAPSSELRGRVVDEQGNGKGGSLVYTAIDQWRAPYPMEESGYATVDGDGNFVLPLGPRRYMLRMHANDGRIGQAVVDARLASTSPITLTVVEPTEVHITAEDTVATYVLVVRTAIGDPCRGVRIEPSWREETLELPPGEHSLDIHDGHGRLLRRMPLHVGSEPIRVEVP